ncbi:hypothetical protein [Cysteiniphilum sp. JM-1]|uniref:hypothetical protein n=1 Tax=Cysteiniphilum sp. JM-1 TaxID=2610891 RepID=UPI001244A855|nr:hypothetical protein [Cysteiniphilum sp. JM-1]
MNIIKYYILSPLFGISLVSLLCSNISFANITIPLNFRMAGDLGEISIDFNPESLITAQPQYSNYVSHEVIHKAHPDLGYKYTQLNLTLTKVYDEDMHTMLYSRISDGGFVVDHPVKNCSRSSDGYVFNLKIAINGSLVKGEIILLHCSGGLFGLEHLYILANNNPNGRYLETVNGHQYTVSHTYYGKGDYAKDSFTFKLR